MYAMIFIPSLIEFSWLGEHTRPLRLTPSAPSKWELGCPSRYKRGGGVKPGVHGFVPKIRTEERMMDFIKIFLEGKK